MNFQAPDFYLMGSISTCRSNSQFSKFFETSACSYYHDEKTISLLHPSYQSVLVEFSRFFRSSKFQLGCRLPMLGFVFNRPSPWRQRGNKIQQVSTGLWPASVSYILSYNIRRHFFTESNTQPISILLLKHMSSIRFLISTYSFTSSYTRIIILKIHKIHFSYLHPYFCCCFPSERWFFLPLVFP